MGGGGPSSVLGEPDGHLGRTALNEGLKEDQEFARQGGENLLERGKNRKKDPRAEKRPSCEG